MKSSLVARGERLVAVVRDLLLFSFMLASFSAPSARGRKPGSMVAVRSKHPIVSRKSTAPTAGNAGDECSAR